MNGTLFSRKFVLTFMFLLNIAFFVLSAIYINYFIYWGISITTLSIFSIIIQRHNEGPAQKVVWILTIILMPFFGAVLYIYSKNTPGTAGERKRFLKISYRSSQLLMENREIRNSFENSEAKFKKIGRYLYSSALMPINSDTEVSYISTGPSYINELLVAISEAKKYIFLEFNKVEDGRVWSELFQVLKDKARLGLEVILVYDDKSSKKGFKDKKTFVKLENHRINAVPFNKQRLFTPSSRYIDNCSMVIIDGTVGFTGSINVSDECVNYKEGETNVGAQKDSGLKVTGDAVWNMAILFMNHYQLATKTSVDITKYKGNIRTSKSKGFAQPFGSSPLIGANKIARDVYIQLLNLADKTIYVTSPYVILDNEMRRTLKLSSQSGVDVRIVLSSHGGNRKLKNLSQTYYSELIKAGAKIYEYDSGVMNSRMIIADDNCAVVGTIPFDFRAISSNMEDGIVLYGKSIVGPTVQDFNEVLTHSRLVTLRDLKRIKITQKVSGQFLRFFTPIF